VKVDIRAMAGTLLFLLLPAVVAGQPKMGPNADFRRWAHDNAIAMRPVDEPYADTAYAFLAQAIGDARVLSIGEMIHYSHEPLELRNHVIRYAVTHLGFTAVAIESGFTESAVVDRFIHGGPGNLDSVVHRGFTSGFDALCEERELVRWLRDYNAHAGHTVRFYGLDVPGDVGDYDGAPQTIRAVLDYVERWSPEKTASLRESLAPLIARFTLTGYPKYSAAERDQLRQGLRALETTLSGDSISYAQSSSPAEYSRALRTAWNAQRLRESLELRTIDSSGHAPSSGSRILAAIRLRDSVMFENARWVVAQQGDSGRVVVFAHNGHAMNVPMVFPAMGPATTMMGQRLRAWLGTRLAIIGTSTSRYPGLTAPAIDESGKVRMEAVPSDLSSWEVALGQLGLGNFAIDLRTSDRDPAVAAMLGAAWVTRIHAFFQPMVPREVADLFVVFDHVTPSETYCLAR
jgi:erythromycin esterase